MSREILFKITCLSCGSDNVKIDTAYDSLWWDDGYSVNCLDCNKAQNNPSYLDRNYEEKYPTANVTSEVVNNFTFDVNIFQKLCNNVYGSQLERVHKDTYGSSILESINNALSQGGTQL